MAEKSERARGEATKIKLRPMVDLRGVPKPDRALEVYRITDSGALAYFGLGLGKRPIDWSTNLQRLYWAIR